MQTSRNLGCGPPVSAYDREGQPSLSGSLPSLRYVHSILFHSFDGEPSNAACDYLESENLPFVHVEDRWERKGAQQAVTQHAKQASAKITSSHAWMPLPSPRTCTLIMATKTLPSDVLLLICEIVGDTHAASVRSFALVCREWASISRVYLNRSISFAITDKSHLCQDIESCLEFLRRIESHGLVQRLEISGPGPYTDPSSVISPSPGWRRAPNEDFGESLYETTRDEKTFDITDKTGNIARWEDVPDSSWQPLASLISQLPALANIVWSCPQPVPSIILDVLHTQLPKSRLWVNTFHFRNLHGPEVEAGELKLMTSSCLHAIHVYYMTAWPSADGGKAAYAHDDEAVMRLVAGLAPRLRIVVLSPRSSFGMPFNNPKPAWEGFRTREPLSPATRGALRTLRIEDGVVTPEVLDSWNDSTNLTKLQSLKLPAETTTATFDKLSQLPLTGLSSLDLSIGREAYTSDEQIEAIQRFLTSMTAALTTLRLEKQIHRLRMEPILKNHSTTLRRLWLLQSTDSSEKPQSWKDRYMPTLSVLSHLHTYCPNLSELAIPIRRTKGDETEVQTYRTLGSLSRLHTLHLTLDCSDYSVLWAWEDPEDDGEGDWPEPPTASHFDDFDQELYPEKFMNQLHVRNGHVRDAFVNCAVDETLARSIFRCISDGKSSGDRALEHLEIKVRGGAVFSGSEGSTLASVRHIIREISRDWSLSRSVRDDRKDEILVKDITKPSSRSELLRPCDEHYGAMKTAEEILWRMWPNLSREGDLWRTQWSSFPLDI